MKGLTGLFGLFWLGCSVADVPIALSVDDLGDKRLRLSAQHSNPEQLTRFEMQIQSDTRIEFVETDDAVCEGVKTLRCSWGFAPWSQGEVRELEISGADGVLVYSAFADANLKAAVGVMEFEVVAEVESVETDAVLAVEVEAQNTDAVPALPVEVGADFFHETEEAEAVISDTDQVVEKRDGLTTDEYFQVLENHKAQVAAQIEAENLPEPLPSWKISADKTLREILSDWVDQAGWNLVWIPEGLNGQIIADAVIDAEFLDAVETLLGPYTVYQDLSGERIALDYQVATGNQVIVVKEVRK